MTPSSNAAATTGTQPWDITSQIGSGLVVMVTVIAGGLFLWKCCTKVVTDPVRGNTNTDNNQNVVTETNNPGIGNTNADNNQLQTGYSHV